MRAEVLAWMLRERRRSIAWWGLGVTALVVLTIAFYPSVRGSAGLSDYSKNLSDAMRALFAGGETDFVSPSGYLNSQIFQLMAPLLLLIFAIGLGASAVAGDEERGTLDLLLAQPLRRADLVLARFAALAALVVALGALLAGAVAVSSAVFDLRIGLGDVLAASVGVALLALLFGAVSLAAGAIRPGRGRAIAIAAAIATAAWLLDALGQVVSWLKPWRTLSPDYHALGTNPLEKGAPWASWALLLGLTGLCLAAAIAGLGRRDVRQ